MCVGTSALSAFWPSCRPTVGGGSRSMRDARGAAITGVGSLLSPMTSLLSSMTSSVVTSSAPRLLTSLFSMITSLSSLALPPRKPPVRSKSAPY